MGGHTFSGKGVGFGVGAGCGFGVGWGFGGAPIGFAGMGAGGGCGIGVGLGWGFGMGFGSEYINPNGLAEAESHAPNVLQHLQYIVKRATTAQPSAPKPLPEGSSS